MLLDPKRLPSREEWVAGLLAILLAYFVSPIDCSFSIPASAQSTNPLGLVAVTFYGTCPPGFNIYKATIIANEVQLAKLACNSYFYSLAQPGTHSFCVNKKCNTVQLYPGNPYFFRIPAHTIGYGFETVQPGVASVEVSYLKALESKRFLAADLVSADLNRPPGSYIKAAAPILGVQSAAVPEQRTTAGSPANAVPVPATQPAAGISLEIQSLEINPQTLSPGAAFLVAGIFTLIDSGAIEGAVAMSYRIKKDDEVLFEGAPQLIPVKCGQPWTFSNSVTSGNEKGLYVFELTLRYKSQSTTKSQVFRIK